MRHRRAALLLSLALTTVGAFLLPSPARAEVDGVDLKITKLPKEFEAGDGAQIVEAVVSTDNQGRCQKVRWSMLMTVDGVGLDDVEVERIEDEDQFPLQVSTEGDTARLTDVRLDPGELCRGRTVTARYEVKFDKGAAAGEVAFNAQAFDANRTLLAQTSASSTVDGTEKAAPAPSSAAPSPEPEESEDAGAIPPPADDSGVSLDPTAASQSNTPSLLGPGLIVGALCVFVGIGLILRMRMRNRKQPRPTHQQYPGYMRM